MNSTLQPAGQKVLAIDDLLAQVYADVEVLARGFESDPGVALLDRMKTDGEALFLPHDLLDLIERCKGLSGRLRLWKLIAKQHETRLVGHAPEMDRAGFRDAHLLG